MRTRDVKLYYCDHCKKKGMVRWRMAKHEQGCTANPTRACGVCGTASTDVAENVAVLAAAGLEALRIAVGTCPACMLAAVRSYMRGHYERALERERAAPPRPIDALDVWHDDAPADPIMEACTKWDYKAERSAYWRERNEESAFAMGGLY